MVVAQMFSRSPDLKGESLQQARYLLLSLVEQVGFLGFLAPVVVQQLSYPLQALLAYNLVMGAAVEVVRAVQVAQAAQANASSRRTKRTFHEPAAA